MKTYAIGVNHAAAQVKLIAYDSKVLRSNQNPNGLTYARILGGFFNLEMEDTVKRNCVNYIKKIIQIISYMITVQMSSDKENKNDSLYCRHKS